MPVIIVTKFTLISTVSIESHAQAVTNFTLLQLKAGVMVKWCEIRIHLKSRKGNLIIFSLYKAI